MNHENAIYNYTTEQNGDTTRFIYNKTALSYKAGFPLMILFGFISIFITSFINPHSVSSMIFTWVFFTCLFSFGAVYLTNLIRSKSGEFSITKKSIIVDGKSYLLEHIKTLSVKNPDGGYTTETIRINNGTLGSGLRGVNDEANNYLRKHIREMQFKIVARFATKDIVIARGLSEVDADILFDKACLIAGYTKSA